MVIVEENKTYDQVLSSGKAPYLKQLSRSFATLANMDAGYPAACPSLAAYILMTGGGTNNICDDRNPVAHQLTGTSIFQQLDAAGRPWRSYAESMPANCSLENGSDGLYLVRHVPATYYLNVRKSCASNVIPLGDTTSGALASDLSSGDLPAYSFVTPNACNDMHGAAGCSGGQVQSGDAWLRQWIPVITQASDFTSGQLVVIITWDEGSGTSNHIPTLILTPHALGATVNRAVTHCSLLRLAEETLTVPALGCAATAPSIQNDLNLN